MPLSKEIYAEFESIVGPANISNDPAILDSYIYSMSQTSLHMGPSYGAFTPRGAAVLLPGCTEEVQAIVKLCNKYKLPLKSSSTFWAAMGYPSEPDTIQLDMRRMDRVLEIDSKNMYAVVEPYVIGSVLQAEAMKLGLNTHIQGPGCSCSLLASATSYSGMGPDAIFMGVGTENLLGLEWVMPNGEIMRTGALGSGIGWFYGDGPGPGARPIVRGAYGAKGAMGVYTKCALKLYPWPGPTSIPVQGTVPAYQAKLGDNFRSYTLSFPSWQSFADTCHQIWDAGIGYIAHRQFNMFGRDIKFAMLKVLTDPNGKLNDIDKWMQDPEVKKVTEEMKRDFQLVLAGMTPRDIEWQDKALDAILAQTGGWKVKAMLETTLHDWSLLYLLKLGHKNLNLVFAGGYDGNFGLAGPPDYGIKYVEEAAQIKSDWEKKGAIVAAGGDCMMGGIATIGGGATVVWENFTCFDPYDKESTDGTYEFFEATSRHGISRGWGSGMERSNAASRGLDGRTTPKEVRNKMLSGPKAAPIYRYQTKIKEAFDPNNLGDQYYLTLEP
jgi:hypothetical protein